MTYLFRRKINALVLAKNFKLKRLNSFVALWVITNDAHGTHTVRVKFILRQVHHRLALLVAKTPHTADLQLKFLPQIHCRVDLIGLTAQEERLRATQLRYSLCFVRPLVAATNGRNLCTRLIPDLHVATIGFIRQHGARRQPIRQSYFERVNVLAQRLYIICQFFINNDNVANSSFGLCLFF